MGWNVYWDSCHHVTSLASVSQCWIVGVISLAPTSCVQLAICPAPIINVWPSDVARECCVVNLSQAPMFPAQRSDHNGMHPLFRSAHLSKLLSGRVLLRTDCRFSSSLSQFGGGGGWESTTPQEFQLPFYNWVLGNPFNLFHSHSFEETLLTVPPPS